ncbi:IS5 family transposase [Streptomyces sp. NBC_00259]|uniref:IS5 family transposase n=1 Tax=Streptomyces sp. NBC_00259 TaxID=2903643 RepID=UPI002E2E42A5|nr:IS5 family transposase [Streptomyces sp. NBC_00259]
MRADLVPDDLWERVAMLLPHSPERRHRHPGRLRVPDRAALAGIMYVLRTGVAWRDVPAEVVGCSGVTAWRRLRDWTEAAEGVWPRLHSALLTELRRADSLDLDDCAVDSSRVRALKGGITSAPRPSTVPVPAPSTIWSSTATEPRSLSRSPAATGTMLDAIPSIRGLRGRPRHKPRRLYADRGYDFDKYRRLLRQRGIKPLIARRGVAHGSGLGKVRWVVERAFAWLHQFKRLRIRYERRADLHQGLLELACSIICLRRLQAAF